VGLVLMFALGLTDVINHVLALVGAATFVLALVVFGFRPTPAGGVPWHRAVEGRPMLFSVLVLIAVLIGGVSELVPTIIAGSNLPSAGSSAVPYRPLELHGRDLYVREGCYNCHSQMIRPLAGDVLRYGEVSVADDSRYDHPFQWGSKRTGPDLARVGGKYPHLWHYEHFKDPRAMSPGSNMPDYAWMATQKIAVGDTSIKMNAMRSLGVPYAAAEVAHSTQDLEKQARSITAELAKADVVLEWDSELVALIAYMQRLGQPNAKPEAATTVSMQGGQ